MVDKYAYVADFEEIKENEFNLNIPRYVDTFEAEEQIDIREVQKEIAGIDADLAKVEKQMAEIFEGVACFMIRIPLPDTWQKKMLSEVAKVQTGIASGRSDIPIRCGYSYLRVANVQDGYFDLREIKTIEIPRHEIAPIFTSKRRCAVH